MPYAFMRPCFSYCFLLGMTDEEKTVKAIREKEKGNEVRAFS